MTKAVMVRCYLLCLLTLALCCACGLVWADSPKASDALIKPSTVGVPSLVRHAIPADVELIVEGDEEEKEEEEDSPHKTEEREKEKLGKERTPDSPNSKGAGDLGSPGALQPNGTDSSLGAHGHKQLQEKNKVELQEGQTDHRADTQGVAVEEISDPLRAKESRDTLVSSDLNRNEVSSELTEPPAASPHPPVAAPALDTPLPVHDGDRSRVPSGDGPTPAKDESNNGDGGSSQPAKSPSQQQEVRNSHDAQNGETTTATGPAATDSQETSVTPSQNTGDASSSSSSTDKTGTRQDESETAVTKPAEDDSNSENSTTTTTTTTTTLPPELTNNKKGDADNSISISSSVWVRVPLLIVVTLACILVC
ncbi:uncharacterized protein TM35_001001050 [Trypanosoma theileri]|uniref:Mucin-associated surface protein (MASP) n=1 Tax=Trypanosoma theileri TaxID=67003 RepID=A0A1X0NF05_9TRYP|nr:uncharacterized protein TM35_001001050 [Trypanosoma theileri]ORC82033.1 hypothetical protein TM35_001001050 [Trypanosoma theileri]